MIRAFLVFSLLMTVKVVVHIFYRFKREWLTGDPPPGWHGVRLIAILNHTSLYEPLLIGYAPLRLLWAFAFHGVLPVAEKTMKRNVGLFFSMLVRHVVVVTRQRDHTWEKVLNHLDPKSVVIILPEGRMKRRNGLDSHGRPMTVRGGIADILEPIESGNILLLYSGGLHHIQAPGDNLPRVFKTLTTRFEFLDVNQYRKQIMDQAGDLTFKQAVIKDMEWRRDVFCPRGEGSSNPQSATSTSQHPA
ncbi:MAG: hypothetical protein GY906_17710 [bacterium]|nr:hypothetical protein [bacterium]